MSVSFIESQILMAECEKSQFYGNGCQFCQIPKNNVRFFEMMSDFCADPLGSIF